MRFSIKKVLILAALATVGSVNGKNTPKLRHKNKITTRGTITKTTTIIAPTTTVSNRKIKNFNTFISNDEIKDLDIDVSSSEDEETVINVCEENDNKEVKVYNCYDGVKADDECVKEYEKDNVYFDMLKLIDYGNETTYVIGHKSPDCDTVGSAIAYADLLNKIGIDAKAVVSGPINTETSYYFNLFGIKSPEILTNAEGKQFVLVDHSNYSQSIDGMKSARIVGIIDHHNVGDVSSEKPIYARFLPVGSAASIVNLIYNELNIPISKEIAQVLIMSILSDTNNLTLVNTKDIDRKALASLKKIAEIEDIDTIYDGMVDARASYGDMTDEEIYKSDYKEYTVNGKTFCVGNVNASGEKKLKEMADRMYDYMEKNYEKSGFNMMFSMVQNINENSNENMTYLLGYGEDAAEVLKNGFEGFDGKYYITKDVLSRKTHVIPVITAFLNEKK